MILEDVAKLAKKLKDFGVANDISIIVSFAGEISNLAKSFKIEELERSLKNFHEIIFNN